jgi:hypothetical protein
VFATNGRDAGQLAGLAEAENGQLVVLIGAGVAALDKEHRAVR